MDHDERVRREFARQVEHFGSAPVVTDSTLIARVVDAVSASPSDCILDLACGPGIMSAALAPGARAVVAFDLTAEMLDAARRRCEKAGVSNVRFEQGSAANLSFADGTFDIVVTRLAIHHFKDPERVVREVRRVLKRQGKFVVADVVSSEDRRKSAVQNAIEVLRDPSHVRMLPPTELRRLILQGGFEIVSETSWDRPREIEEWFGIVDDPERVAPLRTILHALAAGGEDAGFGLSLAEGSVVFVHRWLLMSALRSEG